MPDADDVEYREADGIAYLTLNRPAKLNALGPNSFRLLGEHITRFADSPSAGVAILHGNGGSFAAGADIEHYVGLSVLEYADFMRTGNATQQMLIDCSKPVIAAVHGYALGGGLELALCCDLIVAEQDAQLGLPEARLGLLPGGGGTQRLPRLVGPAKAKDLIFSGRMVDAEEALRIGLADRVVPAADVYASAAELVKPYLNGPALALRAAKLAIDGGLSTDLASGLAWESQLFAGLFATDDRIEGTTAFVEKRKPKFTGR